MTTKEEWLQKAKSGEKKLDFADLSGADLSGVDLSGAELLKADLSGADLSGANLQGAGLFWANLSGADLRKADIRKSRFDDADLRGANLTAILYDQETIWKWSAINDVTIGMDPDEWKARGGSVVPTLTREEWGRRLPVYNQPGNAWGDYSGLSVRHIPRMIPSDNYFLLCRNTNFSEADLQYLCFIDSDFGGANFSEAILIKTLFWESDLSGANLRNANLSGATLTRTPLWYANIQGANFSGTNLNYSTWRGAIADRSTIGIDFDLWKKYAGIVLE